MGLNAGTTTLINMGPKSFMARMRRFVMQWASLLILSVIVVPVTIWHPYNNWPPIRSDGLGYHLWTRAVLKHDLTFCKDLQLAVPAAISYRDLARGICLNRYPPGLALLRFPLMAPFVDVRPGGPLVSPAEHEVNLITGAVALLLVAALALAGTRLLGVNAWAAHISVLVFTFGAGLFHEATYESSFTHIYSALGIALLVWLYLRVRYAESSLPVFATTVITFFLVLIRNTNAIAMGLLIAAYVWEESRRHRRKGFLPTISSLRPALAGIVLGSLIQIAYNSYATHSLRLSSYEKDWFLLHRPMQLAVLFSYENGLFVYMPIVAVALISALAVRRTRVAALLFTSLIAAFTVLYGFSRSWGLKIDLGHRGFVELMPIGIVLFAVALSEMRPCVVRIAVAAVSFAAAFVYLELMLGYWRNLVPFIYTTRAAYWGYVVGKESLLVYLRR